MPFRFLHRAPSSPLANCVERLWYAAGQIDYYDETICPTGNVVLIVNLGDPFQLTLERDSRLVADAWVVGQQHQYLVNRPLGATRTVGATFRPHGAFPVLGVPMSDLGEQVVDLDLLWGGVITQQLRERLYTAPTPEQALSALESVLKARYVREMTAADNGLQRIHHATWWIRRRPAPAIRAVSDQLGCSHKHLIAEFHRYVGLAPQRFLQITRFVEVLDALALVDAGEGQPAVDLADLALSCDYYDQSHFNRDFKRFSGVTPQEYLRRRARVFDVDAAATPQFVPAGATAGDTTAAQRPSEVDNR